MLQIGDESLELRTVVEWKRNAEAILIALDREFETFTINIPSRTGRLVCRRLCDGAG
jgi:hypothetical protein